VRSAVTESLPFFELNPDFPGSGRVLSIRGAGHLYGQESQWNQRWKIIKTGVTAITERIARIRETPLVNMVREAVSQGLS
jgi:hypothetical protein